jgi:hypothetical protein
MLAGCSAEHRLGTVQGSTDNLLHSPDASIDPTCASAPQVVEPLPLDVYMMVDASSESAVFGDYSWDAVASAISGFAASPKASGVSLGLQYFPLLSEGVDCKPADYALPAVEIAPLPDTAVAINHSLFSRTLADPATTRPALEGALSHAATWARDHRTKNIAVVLVTGGPPSSEACDPNDIQACAGVAAAALMGPFRIHTFVVTMGEGFAQADVIAAAGGSRRALPVLTGHDVIPNFVHAMDEVRAAVSCAYPLPVPPDGGVDYDKVNLQIAAADGGAMPLLVNSVVSGGDCDPSVGGWFYDDPSKPTRIIACPATCASIAAMEGAAVEVLFGCDRVTSPPH